MPTPRKRVTFPTPVRKANKKMPVQSKKPVKGAKASSRNKGDEPKVLVNSAPEPPLLEETQPGPMGDAYLFSIMKTRDSEQRLIKHYIEENAMLRSNSSMGFLKNFLGLEIAQTKQSTFEFVWRNRDKMLSFALEEIDEVYYYEYLNAENVEIPEALMGCINFENDQLLKFFLNMFEILLAKYN